MLINKISIISTLNNGYTFQKRDLFNLPPLPDERNTLDTYMDVPNNFYIPDGKNTRLMDCVERKEFERKTIDSNKGFVLQIPFLEHAFGIMYYVVDK